MAFGREVGYSLAARILRVVLLWLLLAGAAQAQLFLNVNKSFSPISPAVGKTATLAITLNNTSPTTSATFIAGTDTLPAGLAFVTGGAGTCGMVPVVGSLYAAGGTLTWSGGTIPPNASCTVTAVVTPLQAGTWVNTIPPANISGNVGSATVSGFATASATITAAGALAGITGTKTASSTVLHGAGTQSFSIALSQANAVPATGLGYTDTLPAGLVLAVPGGVSSNSCGGSTLNGVGGPLADGDGAVVLSGGSVPANGTCTLTLVVRTADTTTSQQASVINSIAAGGVSTTLGITNATAITTTLRIERGVAVGKSFAPATITAGGTSTLALVLSNYNLASVASADLTDTFPSGLTGQSLLGTSGCGAPVVTVNAGNVSVAGASIPGAPSATANGPGSCTISVVVTASAGGYTNTVAAGTFTGGFSYPAASASLVVNAAPGVISGTKTFAPSPAVPGGTTLLTITLGNAATAAATAVAFTDNLASTMGGSVTVAAAPAPTNTCGGTLTATGGATAFSLAGGSIAATSTCVITVPLQIAVNAASGVRTNSLPAGSVSTSLGTNSAALSAALTIAPAITGSKVFNPASTPQGGTSLLTLTINNSSTAVATALRLTDAISTMGASVTIALSPAATNSCGGTLVANGGSTSFSLTTGTLAAGSSCVITVPVQVAPNAATGVRTNTIAVGSVTSSVGANTTAIAGALTIAADIAAAKAFAPTSIPQGGTSVLTITLTNAAGGANAGISTFTETLASMGKSVTIATLPAASTNCGGTLSAAPGTSLITLTGGTIISGGSCQIIVPVVAAGNAATGAGTNTINAGALVTDQGRNANAATAALTITNPLTLAKGFRPATVGPAQTTTVIVTLTHANLSPPFTNLSFTDVLPAGMAVAAVPAATSSCGGSVTANAGSSSFALSGGTLPAGATVCAVSVSVQAPASTGTVTNTIAAGAVTTAEGITNAAAATATLVVSNGTAATLNKQFAPININGGAASVLSIFITNPNAYALNNVALTDAMPAGMTVAPVPNASTNCASGSVAALPGSSSFTLTGATVAANGTCSFQVSVTSTKGGNSINTIPAGTMTSTQGVSNGNAPSATLQVLFNLNVGKAFTPARVPSGGTSTLQLTIYNSNTTTIAGTSPSALTDTLPAGLELASAVASSTCGGTVTNTAGLAISAGDTGFRLNGGSFAPGSQCDIFVTVRSTNPAATGSFVNTIAASRLSTVGGATNPTAASATLFFLAPPAIDKAFSPASIAPGGVSTVTFRLTNTNTATLTPSGFTSVQFSDTLPPGLSVAVPGPAGGSCAGANSNIFSAGQTVLNFSGITIASVSTCTVTVMVTATSAGTYVNTVSGVVSALTPSPTTSVATATLTVLTPPGISKSFAPASVLSGGTGTSVLTITLSNPNSTDVLLATPAVVDVFPTSPGAMLVFNATPTNSCGGTVVNSANTALAVGNGGVRLNGGTVPAGGSCSISVVVNVPVAGNYLNSVPAATSTNAGSSPASATASFSVVQAASLSVVKDNGTTSVAAGTTLNYSITVANAGPADASGTVVKDTPSAGLNCLSLACTPSGGATCPAPTLASLLGTGLAVPSFPAGGQVVFTLTCRVTATGQ